MGVFFFIKIQKFRMFEACAAFVWCLKDHFYAIHSHFWKKKKKVKKKSKNFKVAFLDFFWLQWLSGFQALLVLIFQGIQAKKNLKNIENGSSEGKSQLIWPPSIWVGEPSPIGPRGVAIKNLVQIMMFEAKNSTFLL